MTSQQVQPVASIQIEQVEIDFLMLADRAEVINGKIYMMGGAWDRQQIADFTKPTTISMVVGVVVPWTLTNEPHSVHIFIEHEDGSKLEPQISGVVTVGRPLNATRGQKFRAVVPITAQWILRGPGTYRVVASLQDGQDKRTVFYAQQSPNPSPSR